MAELVVTLLLFGLIAGLIAGVHHAVVSHQSSAQATDAELFTPLGPGVPPPAVPAPMRAPRKRGADGAAFVPAASGPLRGSLCFLTGEPVQNCSCGDCKAWRNTHGT